MEPTKTEGTEYFHQVVDCQWGCPAHTDVPEYIRLIAQGRFTDAYMLNRESNVFPGILGRVCDRPCEPACRRRRVSTPTQHRRRIDADACRRDGLRPAGGGGRGLLGAPSMPLPRTAPLQLPIPRAGGAGTDPETRQAHRVAEPEVSALRLPTHPSPSLA